MRPCTRPPSSPCGSGAANVVAGTYLDVPLVRGDVERRISVDLLGEIERGASADEHAHHLELARVGRAPQRRTRLPQFSTVCRHNSACVFAAVYSTYLQPCSARGTAHARSKCRIYSAQARRAAETTSACARSLEAAVLVAFGDAVERHCVRRARPCPTTPALPSRSR
eukprot:2722777-Pleurochrysis_carterae.AAC.1